MLISIMWIAHSYNAHREIFALRCIVSQCIITPLESALSHTTGHNGIHSHSVSILFQVYFTLKNTKNNCVRNSFGIAHTSTLYATWYKIVNAPLKQKKITQKDFSQRSLVQLTVELASSSVKYFLTNKVH